MRWKYTDKVRPCGAGTFEAQRAAPVGRTSVTKRDVALELPLPERIERHAVGPPVVSERQRWQRPQNTRQDGIRRDRGAISSRFEQNDVAQAVT